MIDDRELVVRSAVTRWILARSASKDTVGDISVARTVEIRLPILGCRQVDVVRFDPGSPFADVSIKLSPRNRVIEVLHARGYSVIEADRRS